MPSHKKAAVPPPPPQLNPAPVVQGQPDPLQVGVVPAVNPLVPADPLAAAAAAPIPPPALVLDAASLALLTQTIAQMVRDQLAPLQLNLPAQPAIAPPPPPPVLPLPAALVGPLPPPVPLQPAAPAGIPPPPVPPVFPHPSHLRSYPPGYADPSTLLAAAQQPAPVSAQTTHVHFNGQHSPINGHIAIGFHQHGFAPVAAARPLNFDDFTAALPKGLHPAAIAPSTKVPDSAPKFKEYLDFWHTSLRPCLRDPGTIFKVIDFINACKHIADILPIEHTLKYWAACVDAYRDREYNFDTATYGLAYAHHVSPYIVPKKTAGAWPPTSGKRQHHPSDTSDSSRPNKKTVKTRSPSAEPTAVSPSAYCSYGNHGSLPTRHLNKDCRQQHPELPKPSGGRGQQAASST